jgi:DHA2 family methylenomycin A resistance protein-like MFS transporter
MLRRALKRPGPSPRLSIGMVVLMIIACAAFRRIERTAGHPLLRVPAPARRPLGAASAIAGLMNLCSLGSLFLLTQVFQDTYRLAPFAAGLLLLPAMLPLPLLGVPASIGRPAYPVLIGSLALWGSGLGILTPAIVAAALRAVPGAAGIASGASNIARQAGGALGVAVFAALAGSPDDRAFAQHTSWLLAGAAGVFTVTALASFGVRAAAVRAGRGDTADHVDRHDDRDGQPVDRR